MRQIRNSADIEAEIRTAEAKLISTHGRAKKIQAAVVGRDMTAEEQSSIDSLLRAFDQAEEHLRALKAELREAKGIEADYAEFAGTPGRQTLPAALDYEMPRKPGFGPQITSGSAARIAPVIDMSVPVRPANYASLFGPAPAAHGGLQFTDFLHSLAAGDSAVLRAIRNQNLTTSGVDGGFAVPQAWSAALMDSVFQQSQFLRYCRTLPLTGQSTSFPVINQTDRSKGPGELSAESVAEGSAATRQTIKFKELTLTAKKRMVFWSASSELLQDSVPGTSESMIASAASTIAMQIDREIWNGSGVNQMLGVNAAPCSIVHAKDGGQSASTVTYTNLSGMVSRLLPSSWNAAIWVIHPSVLTALFGVYLATGASGGLPLPLSQGADGSYRLFGRPIVVSDFAAPLSSQGDISLVDLSYFVVGMREDLRFEVSREHLFDSDEVAFRSVQRRDGQPLLDAAVTPARGSTTLSPFVVLQAR